MAFASPILVALPRTDLGSECELVGGGQGRERGTRRRGR
jgi:hypothetical protein